MAKQVSCRPLSLPDDFESRKFQVSVSPSPCHVCPAKNSTRGVSCRDQTEMAKSSSSVHESRAVSSPEERQETSVPVIFLVQFRLLYNKVNPTTGAAVHAVAVETKDHSRCRLRMHVATFPAKSIIILTAFSGHRAAL
uniref:Uncharacterized protein n=1 Tax=Oryza brachyantha TaxID=4533 RepID=J3KZC3_ORYBR